MKKRTINGREIEHLDVIHHRTTTKFNIADRIRILFGKKAFTDSEIYTQHEEAKVVGSEARTYVEHFIKPKPKGMTNTIINPNPPTHDKQKEFQEHQSLDSRIKEACIQS